ncbi:MAG TPA: phosphoenolpyruvate kinase, partial [Chitinophagaceae bacterium]|nr:phosphoenolpyruvate kinase [Chitinophagaceae bacterium]
MNYTIPLNKKEKLFGSLKEANTAFQKIYPGDRSERQPVHTLYGGANLFKYDSAITLGERALEVLETYAPDHKVFGDVFGFNDPGFSKQIHDKVINKLKK